MHLFKGHVNKLSGNRYNNLLLCSAALTEVFEDGYNNLPCTSAEADISDTTIFVHLLKFLLYASSIFSYRKNSKNWDT